MRDLSSLIFFLQLCVNIITIAINIVFVTGNVIFFTNVVILIIVYLTCIINIKADIYLVASSLPIFPVVTSTVVHLFVQ